MDGKRSCRLYPSLPQTDIREAGGPMGATPQVLRSRSTDVQVGTSMSVGRSDE